MDVPVQERITAAIYQRRVVRFRYLHATRAIGERTCQPHVLFEDGSGHLLLDAVQVAGPSDSGADTPWRTFDPAFMADLDVLPQGFEPHPGMNLAAPKYRRIHAHC